VRRPSSWHRSGSRGAAWRRRLVHPPNINQEMLAEMIGTTRSRVSFVMNKFRKLGFIDYNGKLEVHSSLLNVVLYDKLDSKI
jgi:CRP-like cAMP-binding protein